MTDFPEFKEINGELFIKFDDMYWVGCNGKIYSCYSNKLLKHYIDIDGYHRVDIHGKHMKIAKLVYMTWNGPIPEGKLIRHLDDDKDNNYCFNLVLGSQKDNISDAFRNNHKDCAGNSYHLRVYDRINDEELIFCPAHTICDYVNQRTPSNGCMKKVFKRKWFTDRFDIIEYKLGRCRD